MATSLERLQAWYESHCDGGWEHEFGVHISTLDNPGWSAAIDLEDTELGNRQFDRVEIERSDNDWIRCWVADAKFQIRCGPLNLSEGLEIFLGWAGRHDL